MKNYFTKLTSLALILCMTATLVFGCSGQTESTKGADETDAPKTTEASNETEAPTPAPTEAETEAPTEEPTQAPVTEGEYGIPEMTVAGASVYSGTPDTSWYTGTAAEYTLTTADQLMGFQELRAQESAVNFEGVTIKLDADMTINEGTIADLKANGGVIWKNLNSDNEFKGTFDGQGHIVSGVYMKLSKAANKGMFGTLGTGAVIKNLTLNSSYFCGPSVAEKANFGAIAGTITGEEVTISDVHVNALIEAVEGTALKNVGGFIGSISAQVKLTVENCSFDGAVISDGECVGGYIGYLTHSKADVTMTNCTSTGTVEGTDCVGDFIGWAKKYTNLSMEGCTGNGEQIGLKGND